MRYNQNEIYLDIIEELDTIVDKHGMTVSSEVSGFIVANSKLSGVPDLALSFLDPGLIDDCSFHPCVRYNRFERDKVVSFVPPDGIFELMRYRVNSRGPIAAPCSCQPIITFDGNKGTVLVTAECRQNSSLLFPDNKKPANFVIDVVITIPFSRNVKTANLNVTAGIILFDESSKIAKWNIGKLAGETFPQLTGNIILNNIAVGDEVPSIEMDWKVSYTAVF